MGKVFDLNWFFEIGGYKIEYMFVMCCCKVVGEGNFVCLVLVIFLDQFYQEDLCEVFEYYVGIYVVQL